MTDTNAPNDGTCDAPDCDEVTTLDMAAIFLDDPWFCSPACARTYLGQMDSAPSSVTLNDPQLEVDRTSLPRVGKADEEMTKKVSGMAEAEDAIAEIEEMYPGEFRPAQNTNVE